MKIEVVSNGRKMIKIMFPISFVVFIFRFIPRFAFKFMLKDDHTVPDIKEIDFKVMSKAFWQLRKYKGLKIVEIQSSDGTKVNIQV